MTITTPQILVDRMREIAHLQAVLRRKNRRIAGQRVALKEANTRIRGLLRAFESIDRAHDLGEAQVIASEVLRYSDELDRVQPPVPKDEPLREAQQIEDPEDADDLAAITRAVDVMAAARPADVTPPTDDVARACTGCGHPLWRHSDVGCLVNASDEEEACGWAFCRCRQFDGSLPDLFGGAEIVGSDIPF